MIPTVAPNSSPALASTSASLGGAGIINSNNLMNNQYNAKAATIGIASLILEGRALSFNDYQPVTANSSTKAANTKLVGAAGGFAFGTSFDAESNTSAAAAFCPSPPRASTSRAAFGNASNVSAYNSGATAPHVINITTNPTSYGWKIANASRLYDAGGSSSSSAASSAESTHQRWTQKLCQLRQSSPAANHLHTAFEQKIAIEAQGTAIEPELVSLAIHDVPNRVGQSEFEIMHRVLLHRANLRAAERGSAAVNAHATDNFLYSLQSLASTCLRVGSTAGSSSSATVAASSAERFATPILSNRHMQQQQQQRDYYFTPHLSSTNNRWESPGSASSSGSGVQSPGINWTTTAGAAAAARDLNKTQLQPTAMSRYATVTTAPIAAAATSTSTTAAGAAANAKNKAQPQQGPHCELFLRKMGMSKAETAEAEEHICDMSYVNITCSRWQAYCQKIKSIMERGEPVCIEVYLGPVSHKILLEQWIITQKEKIPAPTMSLPSLCSAIRSQLYFSQISAWCDLIRKSDTIYDTGRVVFPTPISVAGDLATNCNNTTATAAGSSVSAATTAINISSNLDQTKRQQARLNIFYRIIKFDSTASFTTKPNVHNFPYVNISDNSCISVCLKSLPRINGGIPKIGAVNTMPADAAAAIVANEQANKTTAKQTQCAMETPKTSRANAMTIATTMTKPTATSAATSAATATVCDSKKGSSSSNGTQQQQKLAAFFIDEDELCVDDLDVEEDDASDNAKAGNADLLRREKQLQKYRKRMQKRDKKHKKPADDAQQPMEQCEEQHVHCFAASNKRANAQQIEMISTGTQTTTNNNCCQQCGAEKAQICLHCNSNMLLANTTPLVPTLPTDADELDDTSSISSSDIITTPRTEGERLLQSIQRTPKMAKLKKLAIAMHSSLDDDDAEASNAAAAAILTTTPTTKTRAAINLNNNIMPIAAAATGCQVCKRQKTQHNFAARAAQNEQHQQQQRTEQMQQQQPQQSSEQTATTADEEQAQDDDADGNANNAKLIECAEINTENIVPNADNAECKIMQEEVFLGHTNVYSIKKLARTAINQHFACKRAMHSCTLSSNKQLNGHSDSQQYYTPKPLLLQISNNFEQTNGSTSTSFTTTGGIRKLLPKVNLTPIFCSSSAGACLSSCLSSPIPISSNTGNATEPSFNFDAALLHAQSTLNHNNNNNNNTAHIVDTGIPVQKSFSAPTLPNSPSLSPRFAKQAAIYKRRSRHLSDRSDRSSLGSDEQFSDEETEFGSICSPAQSPMKAQTFLNTPYKRRPLLGNLEEALLQNRLMPKTEFYGFKVMLGASGSFCPKQLTLPAMAYFYELHGETLSTPYVCDIRLPRKGYSVPRFGKVQATLLNPMGTVVRIFVIPYDMRDMPPLHQTFIRQRILAAGSETLKQEQQHAANNNDNPYAKLGGGDGGTTTEAIKNDNDGRYKLSPNGGLHGEGNLGHFISAEHMKRLRYSIHLRFQTSRSGRLTLHTNIRLLISRRTDCDTAAAHAKGVLEAPNDLITDTVMPFNPKYSARSDVVVAASSNTSNNLSTSYSYCSNNNGSNASGSKI